jgi:succinate dehydrogenase/fumarate reductase flavoprotein subunit
MTENKGRAIRRREILTGGGFALGAAVLAGGTTAKAAPKAQPAWDYEADVVCVGSGAAAGAAAVTAVGQGASVILVEKMPLVGGTTGKSAGVVWIPNHALLRARGIEDKREDCLRFMARYSYPQNYDPASPTLGLTELNYRLLETRYDNGWRMVDYMQAQGALHFEEFNLFAINRPAPDYADHLPENKLPTGRCLLPVTAPDGSMLGSSIVAQLEAWLRARNVPILTEHRVSKILTDTGRVIGLEAESNGKTVRIKARRGVVFGTGGYAHNVKLVEKHQIALYGACALPGSTGDFISLAGEIGAQMGTLNTAWRTQVVLEEALENRAIGQGAFVLPGDSMILVNKYGRRVVNEKRDYNDRTQVHFVYDPTREEYPNQLMFMVFDDHSLDAFGGNFPFPVDKRESRFLIQGATWEELTANIAARLQKIAGKTGGVALAADYAANLKATLAKYNGHAKAGHDPEFDRGLYEYDREWHLLFSARRKDTKVPVNPYPNITMHPFAKTGPYYAFILAAGALDTSGGPQINEKAQVLDTHDQPISGLYGAGNCIASPTRAAYYGAGATLGLALTFGYIAGMNAIKNPVI